jgi:hypothetical protein
VSFVAITLCVASQRVFIVVVDFVIDTVRKILDIPSQHDPVHMMGEFFNCTALHVSIFLSQEKYKNSYEI